MTETIKAGDTISVHYTGRLENGEVFDSSVGKEPLVFTLGQRHVIQGFENAVLGLSVGDKTTVTIPPEQGYGKRKKENLLKMPRTNIPPERTPTVGAQVALSNERGKSVQATVIEITEREILFDLNHRLAGKTLEFEIELIETGLEPEDHSQHDCDCHKH